ncbi:uridine diphosphate-N-acetylglucosamine-binding protein YvcK [Angustibacter sp. Root456]|uniref:gluconeogenesis factor YvcK family protein n=1 Tax=Angustibacter sp. Root456 TaxID=1736539 RepID=UPI0006F449B7|nr:uridine diphosphate-N-acetylglucosamine-binding protein YvcK [Angustibacter sp. Root456]KQX66625.1 hypothetical protein ASD06_04500 [Angustibacter sp. Root456]
MSAPAVVALGGGHGLAASLGALRHLTDRLTAVVTVADDGGSSGRLRRELGVLPPGDLRMALAALCADGDWGTTWRDVLQHRFASQGELHNHSVGNLLIVALWELLGDSVQGLDWVGRLLGVQGRVLPMSSVPLDIEATVVGLDPTCPTDEQVVRGQSQVARARGDVTAVRLVPQDAPACAEALEAVRAADWVVLGPGSWFTSVMPHLLVPELRDAVCDTPAKRLVTLNLTADDETGALSAADLLDSLSQHAPQFRADVVLADPAVAFVRHELEEAAARLGATLVVSSVAHPGRPGVHDPLRLAAAYRDVLR